MTNQAPTVRRRVTGWTLVAVVLMIAGLWEPFRLAQQNENFAARLFCQVVVGAGGIVLLLVLLNAVPYLLNLEKTVVGPVEKRYFRQGSNGTTSYLTYFVVVNNIPFHIEHDDFELLSVGDQVRVRYFPTFLPFKKVRRPHVCQKESLPNLTPKPRQK